jgi:FkbM family methyltransferase
MIFHDYEKTKRLIGRIGIFLYSVNPRVYNFFKYLEKRPYKFFKKIILTALFSNDIVVEVGAYDGEGLMDKCYYRGCKLYQFEPDPQMFGIIQEKIKKNRLKNIFVFNKAVSDYDGKGKFYVSNKKYCSSLSKFNENMDKFWDKGIVNDAHTVGEIEVDVARLDSFMAEQKIKKIDFLEIDAQGEDFKVVRSLGDRLKDIKRIQVEIWVKGPTVYVSQFEREEIVNYMIGRGFSVEKAWKQTFGREENIIFKNSSV